jgi:tRNA (guanine37-N1)-methyltransferase
LLAPSVKINLEGLSTEELAFVQREGAEPTTFTIEQDYTCFSADEVLAKLLPQGVEVPSGFETIGHIAHLNLRDCHQNFKYTIGEVILDKNRHIRTVVNKTGTIETAFRTFPMEVLAGDDDMEVEVREDNAIFRFNFAEVYWNSRLQHEHQRLVNTISSKDVVCMFTLFLHVLNVPRFCI